MSSGILHSRICILSDVLIQFIISFPLHLHYENSMPYSIASLAKKAKKVIFFLKRPNWYIFPKYVL